MDDVLTLISQTLAQNSTGSFVVTCEERAEIWGTVSSVNRTEWYAAGHDGLNPEIVFTTPLVNYSGQREAEYRYIRYEIFRTYFQPESDMIELYLQRKAGVQ